MQVNNSNIHKNGFSYCLSDTFFLNRFTYFLLKASTGLENLQQVHHLDHQLLITASRVCLQLSLGHLFKQEGRIFSVVTRKQEAPARGLFTGKNTEKRSSKKIIKYSLRPAQNYYVSHFGTITDYDPQHGKILILHQSKFTLLIPCSNFI